MLREREAINLYVFGHLIHKCKKNCILYNAKQIGIEVSVPQLNTSTLNQIKQLGKSNEANPQVCKDLELNMSY